MQLILASNSPRRRELLVTICRDFTVEPSRFEEKPEGLPARETAARFARRKAEEVFSRFPDAAVLGADTVVALDGKIFGKPKDAEDAARMLRLLSGREHSVFTGVCAVSGRGRTERIVESRVTFRPLGPDLIEAYVKSGLPLDKAGGYGIQDGYPLVEKYEGSYTNIVGLPVKETRELLEEGGYLC